MGSKLLVALSALAALMPVVAGASMESLSGGAAGSMLKDAIAWAQDQNLDVPSLVETGSGLRREEMFQKVRRRKRSVTMDSFNNEVDVVCIRTAKEVVAASTCLAPAAFNLRVSAMSFIQVLNFYANAIETFSTDWKQALSNFSTATPRGASLLLESAAFLEEDSSVREAVPENPVAPEYPSRGPTLNFESVPVQSPDYRPDADYYKPDVAPDRTQGLDDPNSDQGKWRTDGQMSRYTDDEKARWQREDVNHNVQFDKYTPEGPNPDWVSPWENDGTKVDYNLEEFAQRFIFWRNEHLSTYNALVLATGPYQAAARAYFKVLRRYAKEIDRQRSTSMMVFEGVESPNNTKVMNAVRLYKQDDLMKHTLWDDTFELQKRKERLGNKLKMDLLGDLLPEKEESVQVRFLAARDKFDKCVTELRRRIPFFLACEAAHNGAEAIIKVKERDDDFLYKTYVPDMSERYLDAAQGTATSTNEALHCVENAREEFDVAAKAYIYILEQMADDVEKTAERWSASLDDLGKAWSNAPFGVLITRASIPSVSLKQKMQGDMDRTQEVIDNLGKRHPSLLLRHKHKQDPGPPRTDINVFTDSQPEEYDPIDFLMLYKVAFRDARDAHFRAYKQFMWTMGPYRTGTESYLSALKSFAKEVEHKTTTWLGGPVPATDGAPQPPRAKFGDDLEEEVAELTSGSNYDMYWSSYRNAMEMSQTAKKVVAAAMRKQAERVYARMKAEKTIARLSAGGKPASNAVMGRGRLRTETWSQAEMTKERQNAELGVEPSSLLEESAPGSKVAARLVPGSDKIDELRQSGKASDEFYYNDVEHLAGLLKNGGGSLLETAASASGPATTEDENTFKKFDAEEVDAFGKPIDVPDQSVANTGGPNGTAVAEPVEGDSVNGWNNVSQDNGTAPNKAGGYEIINGKDPYVQEPKGNERWDWKDRSTRPQHLNSNDYGLKYRLARDYFIQCNSIVEKVMTAFIDAWAASQELTDNDRICGGRVRKVTERPKVPEHTPLKKQSLWHENDGFNTGTEHTLDDPTVGGTIYEGAKYPPYDKEGVAAPAASEETAGEVAGEPAVPATETLLQKPKSVARSAEQKASEDEELENEDEWLQQAKKAVNAMVTKVASNMDGGARADE